MITTLFIIYVVIAASNLDEAFTTLSASSSSYTSGSITSYDDFIRAFQGAIGAFVVIPAVILDIVLLPRIFTFVLLSRDWRNLKKRKLHSYTRTITFFLMIAILFAGIIAEGVYIGTGNVLVSALSTPFIVLFVL